ncbi:MAG: N-acetylglucosamine-6-phosphate deacetylase [Acetobacteraceae bacterium]|nr:N-acetylglucosamine-6-phosphate deacetylase [Acetobacteraceae bacterium]
MRSDGLFDLQVNGYGGVDFNDEAITPGDLDRALAAMVEDGVTACLPTLITAPAEVLGARLEALDRAVGQSRLGPVMVPGYHLEGPFLNPAQGYAGCHPPAAIIAPDPALLEREAALLTRPILLVTLAPEREGAEALIRRARAMGAVVSLGHTAASAADVARAVDAGATLSTHLGNGLAQMLPKFANPLMAQLADDRLCASFIADGIHIPRDVLRVFIRAKQPERCLLVTDGTAASHAAPGRYRLAGMTIERSPDGSVRVPGGTTLAGSSLTLDAAVRNVVAWGIADADAALRMASAAPTALLAPALAAHSIALADSEVEWSTDLRPMRVKAGPIAISAGSALN